MNYIWETVTVKRRGDTELSDISFVPAENFSPYMEVNFEELNNTALPDDLRIELNPFVRFNKIFGGFLRPELLDFPEFRERFFDILMHLLLAADKRSGYDRRRIWMLFMKRNIESGDCETEISEKFALLGEKEKNWLTNGLVSLYKCGISVYLHREIFRKFFPSMISYLKTQGKRVLLLYIPYKRTPEREAAAFLCQWFFLPEDLKTEYYWERHFGIFDIPETIRLDETVFV
jgi:hypothetical protein